MGDYARFELSVGISPATELIEPDGSVGFGDGWVGVANGRIAVGVVDIELHRLASERFVDIGDCAAVEGIRAPRLQLHPLTSRHIQRVLHGIAGVVFGRAPEIGIEPGHGGCGADIDAALPHPPDILHDALLWPRANLDVGTHIAH